MGGGGLEVYFTLDGGEWPASRPGRYNLGERTAPAFLPQGANNHYICIYTYNLTV